MSTKKSGIWGLAMPLSVVFLAAVYYIKVPEVRKAVDAKTPVVHDLLGRFVRESGTRVVMLPGEQDPTFANSKPSPGSVAVKAVATPAPTITKAPDSVAPPTAPTVSVPPEESNPAAPSGATDLQKIASDPTKWPKKVALKKAATFPAVLNGKIVGSLVAPAGAEANVIQMKDDKVGLEYNGGGAMIPLAETDFLARLQSH